MAYEFALPHSRVSIALHSLAFISLGLLFAPAAAAQIDEATAAELRAQIAALSARLETLESESRTAENQNSPAPAARLMDNIRISGDLRPRYEYIDDDSRPDPRNRIRLRARLGLDATVTEDWSISLGLASGDNDPISTNQTLGNGGSSKSLVLDYAHLDYRGFDHTVISVGKNKNPFYRAGGQSLLFDGDYRPEGLALRYAVNDFFFNAAAIILESDDGGLGIGDTKTMWGSQAGYRLDVNERPLTIGLGYFTASVAGSRPFYGGNNYGNSTDGSNAFLKDYDVLELFADYSLALGSYNLGLFADLVQNLATGSDDTGWTAGATLGRAPWRLGYRYQDLEADAVYGALADSDFGGGGTEVKGHVLSGNLNLARNTSLGLSYFLNNKFGAAETDYERFQLDLSLSF